MFYRECGNFKDRYAGDMAIFPIPLDTLVAITSGQIVDVKRD